MASPSSGSTTAASGEQTSATGEAARTGAEPVTPSRSPVDEEGDNGRGAEEETGTKAEKKSNVVKERRETQNDLRRICCNAELRAL